MKAQEELTEIKVKQLARLETVSDDMLYLARAVGDMSQGCKSVGLDRLFDNLSSVKQGIWRTKKILDASIFEIKYPDGEFQYGEMVQYVPGHAQDENDPVCDFGYVKEVVSFNQIWVVYLKSFPEATPDNLDRWTAALTNRRDLRKL